MGFIEDLTGVDLYSAPTPEPSKKPLDLFNAGVGSAVSAFTYQMSQRITAQEHAILSARNQHLMQQQEHRYQEARADANAAILNDGPARGLSQAERILESIREPTDFSKSVDSPSGF